MIKKYYSPDEVIYALSQSKIKITLSDLKDLCIRGSLTPSIFFDGNLACITDEKHQDEIDKRQPVAHIESVSWSICFQGYIHSNLFANFLESHIVRVPNTDVFFIVDKIVEDLSKTPIRIPLEENQYIKAFPRKYDDKIQIKQWIRESHNFDGNTFSSRDIVFPYHEVEKLINTSKMSEEIDNNHDSHIKKTGSEIVNTEDLTPEQEITNSKTRNSVSVLIAVLCELNNMDITQPHGDPNKLILGTAERLGAKLGKDFVGKWLNLAKENIK
ncbi:hypothetical protein [Acinetobacter brisouii]